jgi:hypothetical protein
LKKVQEKKRIAKEKKTKGKGSSHQAVTATITKAGAEEAGPVR